MDKDLKWLIIVAVGIVVVLGASLFLDSKYSCLIAYENQQPEWGIMSGCRIVVNGKLTPTDIVRELK